MNKVLKEKITTVLNTFFFLLALSSIFAGCVKTGRFEGSRTFSESVFRMEYTILDREESANLTLSENDQLLVNITHTAGNVDVTVGQDGEEPIYKGTGQENAEFILMIEKAGSYQITVTGHKARGSVSFTRLPAEEK